MGNHYHALVSIPHGRLSEALQRLHTEYSRHHNRRHRRRAHLFRAHCLALDWPWSSAPVHAGIRAATIPLQEMPLCAAFDDSPRWRERYLDLIRQPNEQEPAVAGSE